MSYRKQVLQVKIKRKSIKIITLCIRTLIITKIQYFLDGPNGHEVSYYLKETLPKYLESEITKRSKQTGINKIIMDTFKSVNYKLKFETEIETSVRYFICK